MSQTLDSTKPRLAVTPRSVIRAILLIAGTVGVTFLLARIDPRRLAQALAALDWRPHAPDLRPLLEASVAIQIHVVVVLVALAVGLYLLFGPKGRTAHRVLGWTWAVFMLVAAISSLFIMEVSPGSFSFIHLFSAATLIAAPLGVYYARRHNVKAHKGTMTGLFNGGLLVAGTFAFLPGRLMWQVFFG